MRYVYLLFLMIFTISCGGHSLSGTYKCTGLYETLEFRSDNNVVIKTMGMSFPTTYNISDGYLYIKHDKGGNLSYVIKEDNTLVGEGFAKGKCTKGN